jgi:hypothetical protein
VSERMWSVNLDVSVSGEYQTLGGHSCRPSEKLGALMTSLGAPTTSLGVPTTSLGAPTTRLGALGSAGDISGSASNHSRAVWEKHHLL